MTETEGKLIGVAAFCGMRSRRRMVHSERRKETKISETEARIAALRMRRESPRVDMIEFAYGLTQVKEFEALMQFLGLGLREAGVGKSGRADGDAQVFHGGFGSSHVPVAG